MTDVPSLLKAFQQEIPVNVEGLIRTVGAKLDKNADLPSGISGQVIKDENGVYSISTARNEHYFRQRFTMAHELGHVILHKSILDKVGGVDDNVKYRSTTEGNIYNSHIDLIHEQQANSFAANLLMPSDKVEEAIRSAETEGRTPSLTELYRKFQVSASAMKWRLHTLKWSGRVSD